MSGPQTYDVIIAGGGTAGCIVAGRLADADPSLTILVVEAGPPTRNDVLHLQPCRYLYHLRPESTTVRFHTSAKSDALGGREMVFPCGQCIGGGSSVNFAMYTRAAAVDYDEWAKVHGNSGWSAVELLPFLRKCESYEIEAGKETHGYSGPLKVSSGGFYTEVGKEFLDVAAEYDKTRGTTDDVNGLYECDKYGVTRPDPPVCRWISAETGKRSDIPHHYIYNAEHPNITLLDGFHVKRVIFEGTKAVGIEYVPNKRFRADVPFEVTTARAKRLVVVSAGAFGSPGILERSGVGQKNVLDRVGVAQVVDLPGLGEQYQDHQVIFVPYVAAPEIHTLDGVVTGDKLENDKWNKEWEEHGTGLIAHNGIDSGVKLRPTEKDLAAIGPAFRERWESYYAASPGKPVIWFGNAALQVHSTYELYLGDMSKYEGGKNFCVAWYLQHPASLGRLHITSASDPSAPLDFYGGFLDDPADLALHTWAYKLSREFARRMPCYRGELVGAHPVFAPAATPRAQAHDGPVPMDAPDLAYSAEDDRAVEEWVRATVMSAWHSMGTCAMKPRGKGGVVDSRLNVYGTEGLKVVDMSICPSNVAANTYSTAIVIGEKAAAMIAEELGIPFV
ncbi:alcohol oxidase-like protein [Epithele typhae]|uniref:alcohol oxidase-like protein n=1 Tax=Epithele typhae TaxID=378194 RepID=UPI0020083563|nr:alcohol oxidase-like protein [Epithele typhae]KAH9920880.1 alcohol oxidase-like protein [Epithele typhae]